MAQGLTPLSGLQVLDSPETYSQATPEDRNGSPVNPYHARSGEQVRPYSWESQQTPSGSHGPYGVESELLGEDWTWEPAGNLLQDPLSARAPWTHAAPHPKDPRGDQSVQPDNIARQLIQNAEVQQAARRERPGSLTNQYSRNDAVQDQWAEIWMVDPGHSSLEEVGPQMRSGAAPAGYGNTDRTQSNAHQNSYGYGSKHMHRRYATGSIPGNHMWMRPGGRPLRKSLAGAARPPIGVDSPFHGQDMALPFGIDGAILQATPPQYQGPPSVNIGPPTEATGTPSEVELW